MGGRLHSCNDFKGLMILCSRIAIIFMVSLHVHAQDCNCSIAPCTPPGKAIKEGSGKSEEERGETEE